MPNQPVKVTIEFDTRGRAVLRQTEIDLNRLASQMARLNVLSPGDTRAFRAIQQDASRLADVLQSRVLVVSHRLESAMNNVFSVGMRIGKIMFASIAAGAITAAFATSKLANEFLRINEQFAGLEITLKSTFRSAQIARDIRNELTKITASSTIPFEGLADFTRSASVNPFSRSKISAQSAQGTLSDKDGFLRSSIRLAEQMLAFRPDKTIEDVIFSLREALSGQFRSLVRRFDISLNTISALSKIPTQELKNDPEKIDKALKIFFGKIITPKSVAEYIALPTKQIEQIIEQLVKIPLVKLGDAGFFAKITDSLKNLFGQALDFTNNKIEPIAAKVSDSMGTIYDTLVSAGQSGLESLLKSAGFGSAQNDGSILERTAQATVKGIGIVADRLPEFLASSKKFLDQLLEALTVIAKFVFKIGTLFVKGLNDSPLLTALSALFLVKLPTLFSSLMAGLVRGIGESLINNIRLATANALSAASGPPLPRGGFDSSGRFSTGAFNVRTTEPGLFAAGRINYSQHHPSVVNPVFNSSRQLIDPETRAPVPTAGHGLAYNAATGRYHYTAGSGRTGFASQADVLRTVGPLRTNLNTANGSVSLPSQASQFRSGFGSGVTGALGVGAGGLAGIGAGTGALVGSLATFAAGAALFAGAVYAFQRATDTIEKNFKDFADRVVKGVGRGDSAETSQARLADDFRKLAERFPKEIPDVVLPRNDVVGLNPFLSGLRPNAPTAELQPTTPLSFGGFEDIQGYITKLNEDRQNLEAALSGEKIPLTKLNTQNLTVDTSRVLPPQLVALYKQSQVEIDQQLASLYESRLRLLKERGIAGSNALGAGDTALFRDLQSKLGFITDKDSLGESLKTLSDARKVTSEFIHASGGALVDTVQAFTDSVEDTLDPFIRSIEAFSQTEQRAKNLLQAQFEFSRLVEQHDKGAGFEQAQAKAGEIDTLLQKLSQPKFAGLSFESEGKTLSSADVVKKFSGLSSDLKSGKYIEKELADFKAILDSAQVDIASVSFASLYERVSATTDTLTNLIKGANDSDFLVALESKLNSTKIVTGVTKGAPIGDIVGPQQLDFEFAAAFSADTVKSILDTASSVIVDASKQGEDAFLEQIRSLQARRSLLEKISASASNVPGVNGQASVNATLRPQFLEVDATIKKLRDARDEQRRVSQRGSDLERIGGVNEFLQSGGGKSAEIDLRKLQQAASNPELTFTGLAGKDLDFLKKNSVGDENLDNLLEKYTKLDPILDSTSDAFREQAEVMREMERFDLADQYERAADAALKLRDANKQAMEQLTGGNGIVDSFTKGFVGAMQRMKLEALNFRDVGASMVTTFKEGLGTALWEAAKNIDKAGDAFANFGRKFLDTMGQMLTQKLAAQLLGLVIGGIGSGIAGAFGGAANGVAGGVGDAATNSTGSAFSGQVLMSAAGGYIDRGSGTKDDVPALLMKGEFVIPKAVVEKYGVDHFEAYRSGSADRIQQYAAGGLVYDSPQHYAEGGPVMQAGSNITQSHNAMTNTVVVPITINNSGSSGADDAQNQMPDAEDLRKSVESYIHGYLIRQQRTGGLLSSSNTRR